MTMWKTGQPQQASGESDWQQPRSEAPKDLLLSKADKVEQGNQLFSPASSDEAS